MESSFIGDLHPQLVHFPVALFITYSIIELFGIILNKDFLQRSALLILSLGVVGAFLSAITGNQALNDHLNWNQQSIAVAENHQFFANLTIWFFSGLLILRVFLAVKKKFSSSIRYIFIVLIPFGLYFIFQTGAYGGELIHKHGIGTDLIRDENKSIVE